MVKMLMILNVVSVVLMTPFFVVQLIYCWAASWHDGRGGPYATAAWLYFASAAAKPLVYVTLNANFRRGCREVGSSRPHDRTGSTGPEPAYDILLSNFRRGCREVMCMSAMRCYRRHAYTIASCHSSKLTGDSPYGGEPAWR